MRKFATAKDLHVHAGDLLEEVGKGNEVVIRYRGRPFALLKPLKSASANVIPFKDHGFGMWKDREDMKDVHKWIDKQRAPRYPR